jgi:hypothetical protein
MRRLEHNIKINFKGMECAGVVWINPANGCELINENSDTIKC